MCDFSRHKRLELVASNTEKVGFSEFSEKYLGVKVWPHMQNVVDLMEGRDPEWLHPSMVYEKGTSGLSQLLVNVPPNHAKSMTVSINYATYRVCKDPNINVIIVSKTQDQAKKFLYAIKQRLTHPRYAEMQRRSALLTGSRLPLMSGLLPAFTWGATGTATPKTQPSKPSAWVE